MRVRTTTSHAVIAALTGTLTATVLGGAPAAALPAPEPGSSRVIASYGAGGERVNAPFGEVELLDPAADAALGGAGVLDPVNDLIREVLETEGTGRPPRSVHRHAREVHEAVVRVRERERRLESSRRTGHRVGGGNEHSARERTEREGSAPRLGGRAEDELAGHAVTGRDAVSGAEDLRSAGEQRDRDDRRDRRDRGTDAGVDEAADALDAQVEKLVRAALSGDGSRLGAATTAVLNAAVDLTVGAILDRDAPSAVTLPGRADDSPRERLRDSLDMPFDDPGFPYLPRSWRTTVLFR
jgi:hypothetical protein